MHSHSYLYGLYPLGFGGGLVSQTRAQIPDQVTSGQGQGRGVATGDFYQSLGYDHPHHQFSTEAYVQPVHPGANSQSQHSGDHGTGDTRIDPNLASSHSGASSPTRRRQGTGQSRHPRDEHGEREEAEEEGYDGQEEYDEDEQDEQDDEPNTTRP
jgi:hypothetical protein